MKCWIATLVICLTTLIPTVAQTSETPRVRASIVVASPGKELYTSTGHCGLRLACEERRLDYIFTTKAEDIGHNPLNFLLGRCKMGVACTTTDEFIRRCSEDDSRLMDYELFLPDSIKPALWDYMCKQLVEPSMPYDYVNSGSPQMVTRWITSFIPDDSLFIDNHLFALRDLSRKDVILRDIPPRSWVVTAVHVLAGGQAYRIHVDPTKKILSPTQLIYTLQHSEAYGQHLLSKKPTVLLNLQPYESEGEYDSLMLYIAILTLLLTFMSRSMNRNLRYIAWIPLGLLDIIVTVLLISPLPSTEWNWLIIPFNILPLLLWRWRRAWAIPYGVCCIVWAVVAYLWPHPMSDATLSIMALAAALAAFNERYFLRYPVKA